MWSFFEAHLGDLYLVYGLTLLVLGVLVAVLPRDVVALPFARDLWLIGAFGTLHGVFELVEMRAIQFPDAGALPPWLTATWLLLSFLPLFEFGRRLWQPAATAAHTPRPMARIWTPLAYGAIASAVLVLAVWSSNPAVALATGVRFFLGLPGALLTGTGLLSVLWRQPRRSHPGPLRRPLWIAALGFLAYGLLTPLQYDGSLHLPAWIPTERDFAAVFAVPVQAPRALAAVALTAGLATMIYGANAGVRKIKNQLRLSEKRLNEAQRIARVGSWELDLLHDVLTWSDEIFRIFEIDKTRFGATYGAFLAGVHPEDRETVNAAYTRSLATRKPYEIVHRLQMADGRIKYVIERSETDFDARGKPLRSVGTVQDVTERTRAEHALREVRLRQQSILDSMYAFVGLFTLDGTLLHANRAALAHQGPQPEPKIGREFWTFYHWSYSEATQEQMRSALRRAAAGETVREDFIARMEQGRFATIDITFGPIRDTEGRVIQIVGFGVDITDRKRAEAELQRQRDFAESLIAAAPVIVLLLDLQGAIQYINPNFEQLSGYGLDEVKGKDWFDTFLPLRDRDDARSKFRSADRVGATHGYVNRVVTRAGIEREIEWHDRAMRDEHNAIAGVLRVGVDVTERRRAEAEREAARRRLEGVLGSISDGFFTLNTEWIYTYINERAARLVGKTPQELINRRIWNVFPEAEGSSWHRRYQQVMDTKQPLEFLDHNEQLNVWYEGAVYPFEEGISVYFHEVTERKHAADQIAAQLHEKEVLLREIHHRVKNNLQIVSSLLYLQQERAPGLEIAEVCRECRNRVSAMSLVHEKLYASTDLSHVDFVDYARDLAASLFISFGTDRGRVRLRVDGQRIVFPLDRAISCGLLINEIVSNSLKHAFPDGRAGHIAVDVAEQPDGYEVTVQDDGIGHRFNDMEQPSASLGLRLITRLVAQLGATIERMDGSGTGYRLMLPKEDGA